MYQVELKRKKIENQIAALNNMLGQEGREERYELTKKEDNDNA